MKITTLDKIYCQLELMISSVYKYILKKYLLSKYAYL